MKMSEHVGCLEKELRRSVRQLQVAVVGLAAILATLLLAGWASRTTVLRASRLEIIDGDGRVRATIGSSQHETKVVFTGAPALNGKGVTPKMTFRLGVNSQSMVFDDETGRLVLDTGLLQMSDPGGPPRVQLVRGTPGIFSLKPGPAFLSITDIQGKGSRWPLDDDQLRGGRIDAYQIP